MYESVDAGIRAVSGNAFSFGHLLWYGFLLSLLMGVLVCAFGAGYLLLSGKLAAVGRWISGAQAAAIMADEVATRLWHMLPSFTPDPPLDSGAAEGTHPQIAPPAPPSEAVEYKLAMLDATASLPGTVARAVMGEAVTVEQALRQTISWQAEQLKSRSGGDAQ